MKDDAFLDWWGETNTALVANGEPMLLVGDAWRLYDAGYAPEEILAEPAPAKDDTPDLLTIVSDVYALSRALRDAAQEAEHQHEDSEDDAAIGRRLLSAVCRALPNQIEIERALERIAGISLEAVQ